jgi:hypothetical protein
MPFSNPFTISYPLMIVPSQRNKIKIASTVSGTFLAKREENKTSASKTNAINPIFVQEKQEKAIGPSLRCNRLEADCGSEGMGFDPHLGQSKMRLFSLSILTDKIVLVVQSTPPSTGSLVSV